MKMCLLLFCAHRTNDLTKKLEKVGPFEKSENLKKIATTAKKATWRLRFELDLN